LKACLQEMRRRSDKGINEKSPVFEHIHFHRIIIDEGHEVITRTSYHTIFEQIPASFRWYITGNRYS
jgi:hypothetical protein